MRIRTFLPTTKTLSPAQRPAGATLALGRVRHLRLHQRHRQNHYDAQGYWELANQYWSTGRFNFLSFNSVLRGYLFPLLISPLTLLTADRGWNPLSLTRGVGLCTAAAFFWHSGSGPVAAAGGGPTMPLGRRLVFGLLGLACGGVISIFRSRIFRRCWPGRQRVGRVAGRGSASGGLAGPGRRGRQLPPGLCGFLPLRRCFASGPSAEPVAAARPSASGPVGSHMWRASSSFFIPNKSSIRGTLGSKPLVLTAPPGNPEPIFVSVGKADCVSAL